MVGAENDVYYYVLYDIDGTSILLQVYYRDIERSLDMYKSILEEGFSQGDISKQRLTRRYGKEIYSYYWVDEFALYGWVQDGYFFRLQINEEPNVRHLDYCKITTIPLDIIRPASGNVNENPGTGH